LNNGDFIPHLIDGLLLDPTNPRIDTTSDTIKGFIQRDYAEALQQIALYERGCQALKAHTTILDVLSALKDKALTDGAKECAESTLGILNPPPPIEVDENSLHIMMSCTKPLPLPHLCLTSPRSADQWNVQEIVKLIVADLQARGYLVWFDL
jgi:hypothetical protein